MGRLGPEELAERSSAARILLASCRLCANRCGADRRAGERGACGAGIEIEVASIVRHFGEEPPLVGRGGSGAIFFSRCALACVFCQNHQASQGGVGRPWHPDALARAMLRLQADGAANIDLVTPTHFAPQIIDVLARARRAGLRLPVVWNTNAYETPETLALLEGVVDIWLPDMKYGGDEEALRLSRARNYVETAKRAIRIMYEQVGDLEVGADGIARRGLIVRHLVLPGDLARTEACLAFLASISRTLRVSLMGQYAPCHRASAHPPLDRPLSRAEYERAIEIALSLGLDEAWIQGPESRDAGLPDFRKDEPFSW